MKHTLVLEFTIDDLGSDSFLGYALDQVLAALEGLALDGMRGEGFVRAELDGELLVDKDSNTPEEVMALKSYQTVLKNLEVCNACVKMKI